LKTSVNNYGFFVKLLQDSHLHSLSECLFKVKHLKPTGLKTRIVIFLTAAALLFSSKEASAQYSLTWAGGASGSWNSDANWNIAGLGTGLSYPGNLYNNDVVVFNSSAAVSVSSLPQGSIATLSVANGATVTLTFATGMTFKITGTVTVGTSSAATLNFDGPGDVTGTAAFTLNTSSTLTANTTCSISAASLTMNGSTTATLNGGTTLTGAITVNGTASIGGSATITAASMTLASSTTTTETGNITITGAITVNNAVGAIVSVGSGYKLTDNGGMTVGNYSVTALTFSGAGTESVSGTSTFDQYAILTVNASNTLEYNSGSTINFANYCTLNNAGTVTGTTCTFNCNSVNNQIVSTGAFSFTGGAINLNGSGTEYINTSGTFSISSSCTITVGNTSEYIQNTGTFSAVSSTINLSGSGAYITNFGTFKGTATTFTFGNGNYIINNGSSTFILQPACTFTMNTSGSNINNQGTWTDHGSTYTMEGQGAAIKNTSTVTFNGSTVNMAGGGGNGQYINNSSGATLTADSATNIICGTYQSYVNNAGTMVAGLSNSSCIISLTAQSANVSNTGTFSLGSTSIIYPTAVSTYINNNAGTFTLMSDAYGSAAIGALNTTGGQLSSVSGSFSVQRYYQGSTTYNSTTKRWIERNYRIISSPVYNATYSSNNVYGLNYIVGATANETTGANSLTNAFVTGCTGGSTSAGNPSVYVFRESITPANNKFTSGNFLGITNITYSSTSGDGYITCSDNNPYSLPVGTGVLFFFRGAATNWATRTALPFIAPDNVILTNTGQLNTFSITAKDWYTPGSGNLAYTGTGTTGNYVVRGFNMVGNPYACTIDWCTAYSGSGITRTNITPTIYVFNPVTNQYNTFLATSASGGTATGNASRYIMSGQGFFVQANAPNPVLTFSEAAKAPAQLLTGSNLLMGTPAQQTAGSQVMRLKLSIDSINNDDIAIVFNSSASTAYNVNEDAAYLKGDGAYEGLSSLSSDSVKLSINSFPLPGLQPAIIRLGVNAAYTGVYTFERTQLDEIPKLYDIWLMDKLNKDSLDIRNNATYAFNVSLADTTTYGDNRFELVIRQDPALMVHLLSFNASKATGGSEVVWTTENEQNYTNFVLQRSIDGGTTYTTLEGLVSSAQGAYSFLDSKPVLGADSYRLQITDLNGTVSYSSVVTLMYANTSNTLTASNISVYPNPTSSMLNLAINQTSNEVSVSGQSSLQTSALNPGSNLAADNTVAAYDIKIISMTGSIVRSASSTQPSWQQSVSDLTPGTYVIKVVNSKDNSIVGSSTFIKL
jgi:hypothetical protein